MSEIKKDIGIPLLVGGSVLATEVGFLAASNLWPIMWLWVASAIVASTAAFVAYGVRHNLN